MAYAPSGKRPTVGCSAATTDLTDLWASRVSAILGIIRAGETDHREVANMAAQVGADYQGRFIVELLQNASDQAVAAGLYDSCVTIIRTREFLAFANEGNPFGKDGLRSITSLGVSTKNPENAIGNKGLGFKSVFQVSKSPEIYSSASATESFAAAPGLMFRLSLTPFEDPLLDDAVRSMVADQLVHMAADNSLTVDEAMAEIKAAAPFRFPLPLTARELTVRLGSLPHCPRGQTLVVLPLREAPETTKTVEDAIDELFGNSGASILFLPSVSTIRVIDRARGFTRSVGRRVVGAGRQVERIGQLLTVETSVRSEGKPDIASWRLIRRKMGTPDVVAIEDAAKEAEDINIQAGKLPGSNWDSVRSSPIEVALPLPQETAIAGSPLGAHGRICIGLPTKDLTGTPAWVNAHFHGTISRTNIDLIENGYNALLFTEGVRLHEALIRDFKTDSNGRMRRVATLAFERVNGPLANVLFAPDGQAKSEVILAVDCQTFQTPADTVLPEPGDVNALRLVIPWGEDREGFGLTIPEIELTQNARPLLESLMGTNRDTSKLSALLLDRTHKQISILEHAAQVHRGDGPEFWEEFLTWVVSRFPLDQLTDQLILPVGRDALAMASQKVFLPPSSRRSTEILAEADGEIEEIPNELAQSLKFLDDKAVTLRKPDLRSLTDLASRLAPISGGLVRSPRLDQLINDAVGPLMQELGEDESARQNGIGLLRQAIRWLWMMSETGRERLTSDALRVPVLVLNGRWKWVPSTSVYFGLGWLGEPVDSLLQEAYGQELDRLIVPWEQFSVAFNLRSDEREAWIGALELLGVSRSPKLIRARDMRPAPLVSYSYSELTVATSPCPIPAAQPFWRPYIDSTRKRHVRTATGQRFDFRSITWIDGLEKQESRPAVVKLMLLNPAPFESETSTFLERQLKPNDDALVVTSLWAYAITANNWKVIPSHRDPVAVADAWLIDEPQRGLVRRRLGLLNYVEAPYSEAEQLLHNIGVTTIQTASAKRLLQALGQLGRECATYDADLRVTALALAQDLYSHLQVAYSKPPVIPLPDLKSLSLPLERNREITGVRGDQISGAYYNDEPARAEFIPGFREAYIWPLDTRRAYRDLVAELRRQLGDSSVVFTSHAPVESGFQEDQSIQRTPLLDWLSVRFPQHSVAADLACLLAYTGRVETNPGGDDFKRTWGSFQQASIVHGTFPKHSQRPPYFFDRTTRLLQVSTELTDPDQVAATWMLVGTSYRDTWSAYAKELGRGSPEIFLRDRHITLLQRENVENAIGLSSSERFNNLRAVSFALWLNRLGRQPVSVFETDWDIHARSVRGLCEWLGRPDLQDVFSVTLGLSEEEAALKVIQADVISTNEWQNARVSLGLESWAFSHKVRAWRDTMNQLISILKTCVARAVSVSPIDVEPILRDSRLASPDEEILCIPEDLDEVLPATIRRMQAILEESANIAGVSFLRRRLTTIAVESEGTFAAVALDDAPIRDSQVYQYDDEGKRGSDSRARFDDLMIVVSALAKLFGERITANDIRSDERVSLLINGWWSNRFTMLPAIQRVLQAKAPRTAQRLSDQRVFRDPAPANELLARFNELDVVLIGPRSRHKRNVTILGQERSEDNAVEELLRGTTGAIGQRLKELADLKALTAELGSLSREKVALRIRKGSTRGAHRGGLSSPETRKDREFSGQLGEAFVYEYFRVVLPGFDESAWSSCNRTAYGLTGQGDDALGFDFAYQDVENRFAHSLNRPLCRIEVKSSSGDCTEPFQMTANEWERARESHQVLDTVYIIVRVRNVRDDPEIADVIIDPFGLYEAGHLALANRDMWVHVGAPRANDIPPLVV